MNSRDAIQQELNDLRSSLSFDDNKQPVFTVPEGYFENFAASVWAKVKSRQMVDTADEELKKLSPTLAAIPKKTPYGVPKNYFADLATSLPALTNDEALPELLRTHTKQMPYLVPPHYFDGLAAQVTAKVAKKAKVVPFHTRFMRDAAAAVIAGAIATAGFFYLAGNRSTIDPAKQPAAWVEQKLKNIPKSDIEAFLKTVDTGFGSRELVQKGGEEEVRQLLRDVSATELDAFLSELPVDSEFSNIN